MKPALLLVDLQADYLTATGLEPPADVLVAYAAKLLRECRHRHVSVIHVWTTIHRDDDRRLPHWREQGKWLCVEGTDGHQPPAALRPTERELTVHKSGYSGFADPRLDAALRELKCDTVILAGVHLHACVRMAAMECLDRGYRVLIAEEAVGSNDPLHAAAVRRWLAGSVGGVRVNE